MKNALILCFIIIVSGCGSQKKVGTSKSLPKQQRLQFEKEYYAGAKQKALNNKEKAIEHFEKALAIDENSHESMYQLANVYFQSKQTNKALVWTELAVENNPEFNHWYYGQLGQLYNRSGMYEKAGETFEKMTTHEPKVKKNYIEASNQYLNLAQPDKAILILNKLQENVGVSVESARRLAFIHNKMGNPNLAEVELKKLVNKNPSAPISYEIIAEHYLDNNQFGEAEKAINKIIELEDGAGYPYMMLYDLKAEEGNKEDAFENLKKAFSYNDVPIESKMQLVGGIFLEAEKDPSQLESLEELAGIIKTAHPNEAEPYVLLADIYIQNAAYSEARTSILDALKFDKSDVLVWTKLLFVDSKLTDNSFALDDSKEALSLFPNVIAFYLSYANALIDSKDYKQASSIAKEGLEIALEKPDKIALYTTLASSLEKQQNFLAADGNYAKALKLNPYNPVTLNNYAFSLAERGTDLVKADSLIDLAMKMEKGNPNFLDTKGWVTFKKGNSEKAIDWLNKAINLNPSIEDPYKHLITIYDKKGDESNKEKTKKALEKIRNEGR